MAVRFYQEGRRVLEALIYSKRYCMKGVKETPNKSVMIAGFGVMILGLAVFYLLTYVPVIRVIDPGLTVYEYPYAGIALFPSSFLVIAGLLILVWGAGMNQKVTS